jgi:phosphopentomutase
MKQIFNRVITIVLDGVGVGEAPDAGLYGDVGSNSLANTARVIGGLKLPNLQKLGLGNITHIEGVPPTSSANGGFGKCQPKSAGKDTISGHWELMGIYLPKPFPTYPNGFPQDLLDEFRLKTGRDVIGNKPASGTEIIKELGVEHIQTGKLIVYTSADSVFQIAANEAVVPIDELYRICKLAREILRDDHAVGRVIARPFVGDHPKNFKRTDRRRDYPRLPESPTMMDRLVEARKDVYSVGKIDDIFGHRGITKSNHKLSNRENINSLLEFMDESFEGLLFVNLIEFDMIYGHRNDPVGYANALIEFDRSIPDIQARLKPTDIVVISADHGVDPTTESTDHSREFVPLIVFGEPVKPNVNLGTRESLSDVAATIAENFSLEPPQYGSSFLKEIIRDRSQL